MPFLFGLFGRTKGSDRTITSVETMSLTLHGMRGGCVYQFENQGNQTELRRSRERFKNRETILELEASVPCSTETMLALMNRCGIGRWNGFHGEHPKRVHDGVMFVFSAAVNNGQIIKADGSENFPDGYYEFVRTLDEMLAKKK